MGVIYQASCLCGYETGDLFEGCGMAGANSCRDLATCEYCQIIVSVRSASVRHRCPKCSRKVQILKIDEDMDNDRQLNPIILTCPKCGKVTMKLHEVGLWD